MPQQAMQLGGYVFAVNPPTATNPAVKSVVATEHLSGRSYTVWGTEASRRDITLNWPLLEAAMFAELDAKALLPGTLAFVDQDGQAWTVIAVPPTYESQTPGGSHYVGVTLKLHVVSKP